MERELPTYIISGTKFIVDINKGEIRQKDQEKNVIRFCDMSYTSSGYSFPYDTVIRNIPIGINSNPVKEVEIPMQVVLDPVGIAEKYNLPIAALDRKTDYDILINPDLVQKRLNGVLPVIDIAGHDFIVDYRLNELRPKDDFSTSIRLNDLYYDYGEEKYKAFYQPATHSVIPIDPATIAEVPDGLVQIEFPMECALDPIGAARDFEMDMKVMLLKHPPQEKHTAKVIPIERTNIPKLVEKNKERGHQQAHQGNEHHRRQRRAI